MPLFIAQLINVLMLIGEVVIIISEMFHGNL